MNCPGIDVHYPATKWERFLPVVPMRLKLAPNIRDMEIRPNIQLNQRRFQHNLWLNNIHISLTSLLRRKYLQTDKQYKNIYKSGSYFFQVKLFPRKKLILFIEGHWSSIVHSWHLSWNMSCLHFVQQRYKMKPVHHGNTSF